MAEPLAVAHGKT